MEFIHSDAAPKAIGPYAQAVACGGLLFCSGQTPLDPATMEVIGIEVETQTRRVLQNLELVLGARGLGVADDQVCERRGLLSPTRGSGAAESDRSGGRSAGAAQVACVEGFHRLIAVERSSG